MKRVQVLLVLLLLLSTGLNAVIGQGTIIIVPPPSPTPVPDSDGDGLPDTDDLCPTDPGPRENRGCPMVNPNPPADSDGDGISDSNDACPTVPGTQANQGCPPPGNPPSNEPPPVNPPSELPPGSVPPNEPARFTPPSLPTDGCYVTTVQNIRVNVRNAPDLSGTIIGSLLPGMVYPSLGYVMNGTDMWFVMAVYEGSTGSTGYTSRSVLLASLCAEVPDDISVPTGAADDFTSAPSEEQGIVFVGGWGASQYQYAFNDPNLACEDDLSVWWIQVDNPFTRPLDLQSPDAGECDLFDNVPINIGMSDGSVRFIRGGSSQVPINVQNNIRQISLAALNNLDCDSDGTIDSQQYPFPACLIDELAATIPDMERDKEFPDWWRQLLDLTCSGNWIMMLEIDGDGDEVVTDAQCEADL